MTFVPPWIPPNPLLLFVGQAPAENEARIGRPFIGTDGRQLRKWIKRLGLDPDADCAYTNVVQEYRGTFNYMPTQKEIKEAQIRLEDELPTLYSHVFAVILMGGPACHTVFTGRVGQMHGRHMEWKHPNVSGPEVFACWHPGAYRNAVTPQAKREKEQDILEVLGKAVGIARGEPVPQVELPEYREVERISI